MNRRLFLSIILVTADVAIISVAGYIIFLNRSTVLVENQTQQAQRKIEKTDTSNWKTYRNEEYGFEVIYPDAWSAKVDTSHMAGEIIWPTIVFISPDKPSEVSQLDASVEFIIQRQENPNSLSIKEWYDSQLQRFRAPPLSATDTIIGKRPAIRMEYIGAMGKHFNFFISLNKTDILRISIIQPSSKIKLDEIYMKIVESLNFISQPAVRDTSTKQTCEAVGGRWGRHGELVEEFCILPSSDKGKYCTDSDQCEGDCIAELTPEERRKLIDEFGKHILPKTGKCSQWQQTFGCYPFVENGVVDGILCLD